MNKNNHNVKEYIRPEIYVIALDNEISLTLDSYGTAPGEPGAYNLQSVQSDPFNTNRT